jgi:hypothetical protein
MYHYIVKVPSGGEAFIADDAVIARLYYFNSRDSYLLFDRGDDTEKRFIMVSVKKMTKPTLT